MKPLFKQLSEEDQQKVKCTKYSDLYLSLQCKSYRHDLTIKDMMQLSDALGVDFGILAVTKLFKL